jgi:hypothetical protein
VAAPTPARRDSAPALRSDVSHDDAADDDADFDLEVHVKLTYNSNIIYGKLCGRSTRLTLDIELIWEGLCAVLAERAPDDSWRVVRRFCTAKTLANQGRATSDIDNFYPEDQRTVDELLMSIWRIYRATLHVLFHVHVQGPALRRPRAPETAAAPPAGTQATPQRPSGRTGNMLALADLQQEIRSDHSAEARLVQKWQCVDDKCRNHHNFCFIDSGGAHYAIDTASMRAWAAACNGGEATIANPPITIYRFWHSRQGPVGKDTKTPVKQASERSHAEALDRMMAMSAKHMEAQMTFQLMSSTQRQHDDIVAASDRRELADERREERRDRRDLQHERRDERAYRDRRDAYEALASYPPPPPRSRPPSRPSTANRATPPALEALISSPVNSEDDGDLIPRFFTWRLARVHNERFRELITEAQARVEGLGLTISDLKAMGDPTTWQFAAAKDAGIAPGIYRSFPRYLKDFKRETRALQRDAAAEALTQLTVSESAQTAEFSRSTGQNSAANGNTGVVTTLETLSALEGEPRALYTLYISQSTSSSPPPSSNARSCSWSFSNVSMSTYNPFAAWRKCLTANRSHRESMMARRRNSPKLLKVLLTRSKLRRIQDLSTANVISIGLKSGEYGGKYSMIWPAARMALRISGPVWIATLSSTMTRGRPGSSASTAGRSRFLIHSKKSSALKYPSRTSVQLGRYPHIVYAGRIAHVLPRSILPRYRASWPIGA